MLQKIQENQENQFLISEISNQFMEISSNSIKTCKFNQNINLNINLKQ